LPPGSGTCDPVQRMYFSWVDLMTDGKSLVNYPLKSNLRATQKVKKP
jgi:hypothetical protein